MSKSRLIIAGFALAAGLGLSACAEDGYGGGVAVGYSSGGWDPYYGGFSADPYWGWYGDYYYPGSGYYVYDHNNRRHRWNDQQRGYWQGRSGAWRGRETRPMWRDYGGSRHGDRHRR
jgi:hypothetical protein